MFYCHQYSHRKNDVTSFRAASGIDTIDPQFCEDYMKKVAVSCLTTLSVRTKNSDGRHLITRVSKNDLLHLHGTQSIVVSIFGILE